jgi:hypothetical protein
MSTKSHITSLQRRHSALHDEIEDLQKSPAPDSLELLRLSIRPVMARLDLFLPIPMA